MAGPQRRTGTMVRSASRSRGGGGICIEPWRTRVLGSGPRCSSVSAGRKPAIACSAHSPHCGIKRVKPPSRPDSHSNLLTAGGTAQYQLFAVGHRLAMEAVGPGRGQADYSVHGERFSFPAAALGRRDIEVGQGRFDVAFEVPAVTAGGADAGKALVPRPFP